MSTAMYDKVRYVFQLQSMPEFPVIILIFFGEKKNSYGCLKPIKCCFLYVFFVDVEVVDARWIVHLIEIVRLEGLSCAWRFSMYYIYCYDCMLNIWNVKSDILVQTFVHSNLVTSFMPKINFHSISSSLCFKHWKAN